MKHLAVFDQSQTAGTTNDQINAVNDGLITVQNDRIILSENAELDAVYLQGASVTRARLNYPQARRITLPQIRPITRAANAPTDPNLADLRQRPLRLVRNQEIAVESTNDLGAGTERHSAGLFLRFPTVPYNWARASPNAQVYSLRGTGATTLVANAWTTVPITWDEQLAAGLYEILGFTAQSAGAIFARLILPGGTAYRPGVVAITALGNRPHAMFTQGGWGSLGAYVTTALPGVEFFSNSADTAEVVFLEVAPIRLDEPN